MKLASKFNNLLNKRLGLFFFIAILFWLKTYLVYISEFNLGVTNTMQEFLLFVNPISSALLFLGISLFFSGRKQQFALLGIDFFLSFLLYANVGYYRFFNDFITVPVLAQTQNFGEVSGSVTALLKPHDILYFLDTIVLFLLILFKKVKPQEKLARRPRSIIFLTAIACFCVNLGLAEIDRPQLLTRTFDRNYIVKYLGTYNFAIYDAIQSSKSSAQRAFADSSDVTEIENYTKAHYTKPNPKYFGAAKGKNVIYVSLESFQSFLIDYKLHGQEVTPFLNSLARNENTIYFDNFFHQTGQGKTSDAEFMMENAMFPLPQGSVFTTKAQNTYQAMPAILKGYGYNSAVFHGNYKTFWNREEMYKSLGYDMFYDASYYDMKDEDVLNYGLEDKPFFTQTTPYLKSLKQPFYTKIITLSNHFPYPLNEEDQTIEPAETGDGSVDRYFQTARYLDEAMAQFFADLKASGLYDNSIIVMYGDHYGISENHKEAMAKIIGKDITDFEQTQLQRVPLYIHMPGLDGFTNHTYGGQTDVRQTVLHLLGVDTKDHVVFGSDLLSPDHEQIVPFRNGDFVTDKVTSVKGKLYDNATGEPVEDSGPYEAYKDVVKEELALSDKVVYGDLLRFHKIPGFKQPDPASFDYSKAVHFNDIEKIAEE